ncbi:hypothetical protein BGZ83_002619 [Gryganskiella cystojenkinii]|nr:hypothetical protein BGZ83_002619 [Gryganskiella cystojenkinii]
MKLSAGLKEILEGVENAQYFTSSTPADYDARQYFRGFEDRQEAHQSFEPRGEDNDKTELIRQEPDASDPVVDQRLTPVLNGSDSEGAKDGPTPMDIDNMDIRVALNAIASQVNLLQRNSGFKATNKSSNSRLPVKLTTEDRAYLIANNGCFCYRNLDSSPVLVMPFHSSLARYFSP